MIAKPKENEPKKRKKIFQVGIDEWTGVSNNQDRTEDSLCPMAYERRPPTKLPIWDQLRPCSKKLTGVPPSQKAVRKACSRRVHQLLVTTTKTGPVIDSIRPRKNLLTMIPAKLKQRARGQKTSVCLRTSEKDDNGPDQDCA